MRYYRWLDMKLFREVALKSFENERNRMIACRAQENQTMQPEIELESLSLRYFEDN